MRQSFILDCLSNNILVSGVCNIVVDYEREFQGLKVCTLEGYNHFGGALALPHDEFLFASGNGLKKWTQQTNAVTRLAEPQQRVIACAFVDNKIAFVTAEMDRSIVVFHCVTNEHLVTLASHSGIVITLIVLMNGTLVAGSTDGSVRGWNVTTGEMLFVHANVMCGWILAPLPNGGFAARSRSAHCVEVRNEVGALEWNTADVPLDRASEIVGFDDKLAAILANYSVAVWNLVTQALVVRFDFKHTINSIAFLSTGWLVVAERALNHYDTESQIDVFNSNFVLEKTFTAATAWTLRALGKNRLAVCGSEVVQVYE